MNMANMKSGNHNSENLYVKHFQIADTNYNLFLTEEMMNKLRKRNLFEGKKKMNRKMQIAQRTNTARASLD
jgi:hypothetical protein